jgi:hypothetical protein
VVGAARMAVWWTARRVVGLGGEVRNGEEAWGAFIGSLRPFGRRNIGGGFSRRRRCSGGSLVSGRILGLKWRRQATRQLEQGDGTARAGGRGAGEHGKHTSALSFMRTAKFF